MKVSQQGLELIKYFEGLRLERYFCPAGKPTIGYGHVMKTGEPIKITQEEAEELLKKDLEVFEKELMNLVQVPISQNQFDALLSFIYNLGSKQLGNSTLLTRLNNGFFLECPSEFLRWKHIGQTPSLGLLKRRLREASLFMGINSILD